MYKIKLILIDLYPSYFKIVVKWELFFRCKKNNIFKKKKMQIILRLSATEIKQC